MVWKSILSAGLGLILVAGCSGHSLSDQIPAGKTGADAVVLPGRQKDGSVLLPNQWSLMPAGRQIELGDFPVNIALHPAGRFAAILNGGYSAHEIIIVDIVTEKIASRFRVKESFYGIEFSPDGTRLYCSGAGEELIHRCDFADGKLLNHAKIQLQHTGARNNHIGVSCQRGLLQDERAAPGVEGKAAGPSDGAILVIWA